jgi:hypothetical protein
LFLSLYFFCFCFFLGSCCFLLLCSFFEPHAGGNDRGNTELRKEGGAVAGSVTSLAPAVAATERCTRHNRRRAQTGGALPVEARAHGVRHGTCDGKEEKEQQRGGGRKDKMEKNTPRSATKKRN